MRVSIHNGPTLDATAETPEEAAQAARAAGYDVDPVMGVEQTTDDDDEPVWLVYCGLDTP